jgi:hypothetical protein
VTPPAPAKARCEYRDRGMWRLVRPEFGGVGLVDVMLLSDQEDSMGRRGYPGEFRQRVLDLVEAGRRVGDIAGELGISDQTIYNWRRQ